MSRKLRKAQENGTVMSFKPPSEIYRLTTIGRCLRETLEDFKAEGKITEFIVQQTLKVFDRMMSDFHLQQPQRPFQFIAESVEKQKLVDGLWQLSLRNVTLNPNTPYPTKLPQLGIVASRRE